MAAEARPGGTRPRGPREGGDPVRPALLALSLAALLLVGVLGESAAAPGLGPRGWAPGSLPMSLSPAWTTAVLAAGYVLGAGALARGLLRPPSRPWPWWGALLLGLAVLLTAPFGSADHTNYAAYGQIALHGGDPYLTPPAAWHGGGDPVAGAVQPPWQSATSVYGPVATLLSAGTAWLGDGVMRQVVWCWQVLVVLAWLAVRSLARRLGGDPARVDVVWTANPLVVGVLVLGAHVDAVAAAFALAALVLATGGGGGTRAGPRAGLAAVAAGGVLLGLALSTKVTYGVVGVALVLAWVVLARSARSGAASTSADPPTLTPREALVRSTVLAAAALAVAVPVHVWAGPHVFGPLAAARRSVSLATPWRPPLEAARDLGVEPAARSVVLGVSALACLVLAWLLWRLTAGLAARTPAGQAARATAVLSAAYALGAPYSLPWYDALVWATLPVLALGALDVVALARGLVLALAYVPGRVVALSPAVESVTLSFRRDAAPWLVVAVWAGVTAAAARRPRRGPGRPPGGP